MREKSASPSRKSDRLDNCIKRMLKEKYKPTQECLVRAKDLRFNSSGSAAFAVVIAAQTQNAFEFELLEERHFE